jgi:hypothetical protein
MCGHTCCRCNNSCSGILLNPDGSTLAAIFILICNHIRTRVCTYAKTPRHLYCGYLCQIEGNTSFKLLLTSMNLNKVCFFKVTRSESWLVITNSILMYSSRSCALRQLALNVKHLHDQLDPKNLTNLKMLCNTPYKITFKFSIVKEHLPAVLTAC